jgi:flagellar biosynthesis protein FliP
MKKICIIMLFFMAVFSCQAGYADTVSGIPFLLTNTVSNTSTTYTLSFKILVLMTLLSVLPALLMTTTSFTRIIIVLSILRQALGLGTTPSNQILLGISLFLTLFVMAPTFEKINQVAINPYVNKKISEEVAIQNAEGPIRQFMIKQIRKSDLALFLKLAHKSERMPIDSVPIYIIMPSFLTSELKTAFQMGFLLFLPFLVIDLVVASVLMSMGMMMLSPPLIFVLVNGWVLILGTLARSFGT